MMDILMSETCWAHKKWNKIASDIKLVFYSSTITMMHGPTNIRNSDILWWLWQCGIVCAKCYICLHWWVKSERILWCSSLCLSCIFVMPHFYISDCCPDFSCFPSTHPYRLRWETLTYARITSCASFVIYYFTALLCLYSLCTLLTILKQKEALGNDNDNGHLIVSFSSSFITCSQKSLMSIGIRLWAGWSGAWTPIGAKDFSLLQNV